MGVKFKRVVEKQYFVKVIQHNTVENKNAMVITKTVVLNADITDVVSIASSTG